ncbi:hypothetical protein ONZ45_g18784 [Pleurotus djamor]|nr:hypothetical protein ONZ45_g18784 [Pleurotus djamor]
MEIHSYFLLWQEIGKRMNIQDVPDTFEEMLDWSLKYEEKMMIPAKTNHQVSTATTNELLHAAPEALGIKAFLRRITACLVEDRVRTAMMLEEQPTYLHVLTRSTLLSVKYFQKYLCLPRTKKEMITPQDFPIPSPGSLARLTPTRYAARPWYRPQRTGLGSLLDKLLVVVGFHDDLPQPKYRSEGYRIEEIGPLKYEQQGHDEVFRMAEKLQGCPITGAQRTSFKPTYHEYTMSLPRSNYDPRRVCLNPFPEFSLGKHKRTVGVYLAGALFALANWTFIDAAILSAHAKSPWGSSPSDTPPPVHITFVDWIPGICSILGFLVVVMIDKDRIRGDESFAGDSRAVWRARVVLFIGFALMAGGLAGSITVLVLKYILEEYPEQFTYYGYANVSQNVGLMLSTVVLWIATSGSDEYEYNLTL